MGDIFGTSKGKNRAFALVFIVVWGAIVLINFFVPEQSFSQAENRALAAFPSYSTKRLLDGEFMDDMNTYLNDQFVGRPYWVSGQSLAEYGLGKREINGVYIGDEALFRHYPADNAAATEANIDGVNAFAERYGLPTSVMLVPSSTYIGRDHLPGLAPYWDEGGYIDAVYAGLRDDVTPVDVVPILQAAVFEGPSVYYRTDHHWTSYGAYLAYQELTRVWGLPMRGEEMVPTELSNDFLGTNHSRTGFPLVKADHLYSYQIGNAVHYETYGLRGNDYATTEYDGIYFPEYLEVKDKYTYFLGPLEAYTTIYTDADTDKKLIIFKDSYAHCLAPMLMADYSEIRLVDLRSFRAEDYGAFVEVERYDEALFLYSTDTFSQQLGAGRFAE